MSRDPVTVLTVTLLVIEGRKGKNLKYVFRWNKGTFLHCIVGMNQAIAEKDLEISFFHIYHVIHQIFMQHIFALLHEQSAMHHH